MSRNGLYLIIGVLAAVVAILGYNFYQEEQKSGVQIEINEDGISVEEN